MVVLLLKVHHKLADIMVMVQMLEEGQLQQQVALGVQEVVVLILMVLRDPP